MSSRLRTLQYRYLKGYLVKQGLAGLLSGTGTINKRSHIRAILYWAHLRIHRVFSGKKEMFFQVNFHWEADPGLL